MTLKNVESERALSFPTIMYDYSATLLCKIYMEAPFTLLASRTGFDEVLCYSQTAERSSYFDIIGFKLQPHGTFIDK